MQPLTRGPEADETKTMTVARPHHACVPLSKRRQHRPARSTCADAPVLRCSPLGANTVCKPRNSFADALFTHQYAAQRHTLRRLLEIGVYFGASLRMWRDYFPAAEVVWG